MEYVAQATIIELDVRLGHELALDRWDDLERDIDALAAGSLTQLSVAGIRGVQLAPGASHTPQIT